MSRPFDFESSRWWSFVDVPMRELMSQSRRLITVEEERLASGGQSPQPDYGYVVFPAAKAYEGFLKKLFLNRGLISRRQFLGDRFRIGKSLNPHLPKRYQWDWVYDRLVDCCGSPQLPLKLWEVWRQARNRVFHFFPDLHEFISLDKARELVRQIAQVMDEALVVCRVA